MITRHQATVNASKERLQKIVDEWEAGKRPGASDPNEAPITPLVDVSVSFRTPEYIYMYINSKMGKNCRASSSCIFFLHGTSLDCTRVTHPNQCPRVAAVHTCAPFATFASSNTARLILRLRMVSCRCRRRILTPSADSSGSA